MKIFTALLVAPALCCVAPAAVYADSASAGAAGVGTGIAGAQANGRVDITNPSSITTVPNLAPPSVFAGNGDCPQQTFSGGLTFLGFGAAAGGGGDTTTNCKNHEWAKTVLSLAPLDPKHASLYAMVVLGIACSTNEAVRQNVSAEADPAFKAAVPSCNASAPRVATQTAPTPVASIAAPTRVAAAQPARGEPVSDVADAIFPQPSQSEQYKQMAELRDRYGSGRF